MNCEYHNNCKLADASDICQELYTQCKIRRHNQRYRVRMPETIDQEVLDMIELNGMTSSYSVRGSVE